MYAGKTGDFEWTALHVAASRGFPHVCQALRDIGADTDICDALGNDAYAVSIRQHTSAYVSIRQHTSDIGADTGMCDVLCNDAYTVLTYADIF